jgi:hypothetical protein
LALLSDFHVTILSDADGEHQLAVGSAAKVKRGSRMRFTSPVVGWTLWIVNLVAFAAVCIWILVDGRFPQTVDVLRAAVLQRFDGNLPQSLAWVPSRLPYVMLLGAIAVGSGIGIFVGLFFGAKAHRRVRSWLVFTVLAAAWLSLAVTWREMAWKSQALRVQWRLSGLDSVAASLVADWPAADGERPEIGPFMAYPQGDPRMLMLLTTPEVGRAGVAISAIEKSASGGVRFQLAGNEAGAWLEWHPSRSAPESFRGGLMTEYQLERAKPLADGWFLARYGESF